jgi:hypothetical protein
MSLVSLFDFEIEKMDVKTTFLDGDLEEEISMKQRICTKGQEIFGV